MRRIKLLLAVVAAMTMLVVMSAPAIAHDRDNHHDGFDGHHNTFINDFEAFDYEDFVELDDCELVSLFDGQFVIVCELDF